MKILPNRRAPIRLVLMTVLFCAMCTSWLSLHAEAETIIVITSQKSSVYQKTIKGMQDHLTAHKKSVNLDIRDVGEPSLIEDINRIKPPLLVTMGSKITEMISKKLPDIPIVFSAALLTDKADVQTKNVTGVTLNIPIKDQFTLMQQINPKMKAVGVLYNPELNAGVVKRADSIARPLGLTLSALKVNEYREVVPQLKRWFLTIDFLWIIPDNKVCQPTNLRHLIMQGLRAGLPTMGISQGFLKIGSLIAITADYEDVGKQTGEVIIRVLDGVQPEKIDIVEPRKIKTFLNLTIAKQLRLNIPEKLVDDAVEVIGK